MAKFSVGDRVKCRGERGVVIEVPVLDPEYLKNHQQYYSVRLDAWDTEEYEVNGKKRIRYRRGSETRDHAADSLGCVPEPELEKE